MIQLTDEENCEINLKCEGGLEIIALQTYPYLIISFVAKAD